MDNGNAALSVALEEAEALRKELAAYKAFVRAQKAYADARLTVSAAANDPDAYMEARSELRMCDEALRNAGAVLRQYEEARS